MKIRTLRLLAKEGAYNVYKNKLMSFASLATIMATLFILGLVLLIIINITSNIEIMKQNLEITAFLNVDASLLEKESVALFIEHNKEDGVVSQYRLETKEQAYENIKKDLKDESLLKGFSPENVPDCYYIKLKSPDYSSTFIAQLSQVSGIDKNWIGYPKDNLDKLTGILRVFNIVTLFILVVLMVLSILLISNTIRLTVFARKREIGIMKYVGALDWFIRLPFIVEGMVIGFAGALFSFLVTSQAYQWIKKYLDMLFTSISLPDLKLIDFQPVGLRIILIYVIFGTTIGVIGSMMSVRKHLNV